MSSLRWRKGGIRRRELVQPIKQVRPEPPRRHRRIQILVARRQHPHVNFDRLRAPDPAKGLLLQRPQHFGLHGQRHIQNLVQKQRAPVGLFKAARFAPHRPCERPFFMSEQFRLKKRLRNRPRIHRHKGAFGARTGRVYGLGHHFLARSGFPDDDHAEVGFGHAVQVLNQLSDGLARSHDLRQIMAAVALRGRLFELEIQLPLGQTAPNHPQQFLMVVGFGQVIECRRPHRLHRPVDFRVSRQYHHRHVLVQGFGLAQDFQPVQIRQFQVHNQHVGRPVAQFL